jgi:DNA-binding transcriptional ArsR family regulator
MDKSETILALAALAHDTRLDVFRLLIEAGPNGLAVGHIGEALGVPPATLNHHLAQLKLAGLVVCVRDGRKLIQRADYTRLDGMVSYLMDNCCNSGGCTPTSQSKEA